MPTLRALKTLNEIESQLLDGNALEVRLTDVGHLAEFYSLLSTRSQTRRIASNTTTMAAMSLSNYAHEAILESATIYNTTAAQQLVESSTAMGLISLHLECLNIAIYNDVSWNILIGGPHYETNIKSIVSLFAGIDLSGFATMDAIIQSPAHSYLISLSDKAMEALVNSPTAMATVVDTTTAMEDIVASPTAFTILANNKNSVDLLAASTIGMDTITDAARAIIVGIPTALIHMAAQVEVWKYWMENSATLAENIYDILLTFTDVDSSQFENTEQIFGSAIPMNKIASDRASMVAILNEPDTLALFIASPQIEIALTNPISMAILAGNTDVMVGLVENNVTFPLLMTSTLSKNAMFESTPIIDTIAGNAFAINYLEGIAVEQLASTLPDGSAGTFQDFGFSGKMLMLAARMNSIVATTTNVAFRGDPQYGSQAGTTNAYAGKSASSGYNSHVAAYVDLEWDPKVATATAAAQVYVRYVDFN